MPSILNVKWGYWNISIMKKPLMKRFAVTCLILLTTVLGLKHFDWYVQSTLTPSTSIRSCKVLWPMIKPDSFFDFFNGSFDLLIPNLFVDLLQTYSLLILWHRIYPHFPYQLSSKESGSCWPDHSNTTYHCSQFSSYDQQLSDTFPIWATDWRHWTIANNSNRHFNCFINIKRTKMKFSPV